MTQERLNKVVVRRLQELGLPPALIDVDVFRDKFLFHQWVMYVRDGDEVVNVHLVQPQEPSRELLKAPRKNSRKRPG